MCAHIHKPLPQHPSSLPVEETIKISKTTKGRENVYLQTPNHSSAVTLKQRWTENISTPMPIIAVVGSRRSGKTTTVEALVKGLTKKGYRVATAKHIPETNFTTDTKGKDTWRHAQAGAKTILSVAPNELTIIKKVEITRYGLNNIVRNLENQKIDILILEGFRELVAEDPSVPKLVTAKTAKEIQETSKYFKPILAFTTPTRLNVKEPKIPQIDALKETEKLIEIVDQRFGPIIKKRRASGRENLKIQLDQKTLPLNPFVQKFIRSVILSMVSNLKGATIQGDENVFIEIEPKRKIFK